jgi:hypothetical protein
MQFLLQGGRWSVGSPGDAPDCHFFCGGPRMRPTRTAGLRSRRPQTRVLKQLDRPATSSALLEPRPGASREDSQMLKPLPEQFRT